MRGSRVYSLFAPAIPGSNPTATTSASGFRLQFEPAQERKILLYPEGMVRLNHSAGEILILVDGERSVGQLIEALSERFPEVPEIDRDILAFLEAAHAEHWIEYF